MSLAGQPASEVPVTEVVRSNELAASAAELFRSELLAAVQSRGRFSVALSGGSTPLPLYARLSGLSELPWDKVHVFWGDERFVPHDHLDSNYRNAKSRFLDLLPLPAANIHPWPQPRPGLTLDQAATEYASLLIRTLGEVPTFDLMLLGLGADAHTASLYPNDPAIFQAGLTATAHPPGIEHPRLTLTPEALSNSRTVAFLVSGERKREALTGTFTSAEPDPAFPARFVRALDRRLVLTDLPDTGL